MRIIPAILTSNLEDMTNQLSTVSEFTDDVDIDVMDGKFVTDSTVDISSIPIINPLIYNFDLMVSEPELHITKIIEAKSKGMHIGRVFIHIESNYKLETICNITTTNSFDLGFSLSIETAIENFIDTISRIRASFPNIKPVLQLKTVQIGKQGNPYHPEVLGKIGKVKEQGFNGEIYLDGGMEPDIILSLKNYDLAGVSVGSYISHSSDPMAAYTELRNATWKKRLD